MDASRRRAEAIVRRLVGAGHEAYFCGGCVRDQAMGRSPKDYDIATGARPEEVQALFPRTHPVGVQFGVVLVVEEDEAFQVATFRTESGYSDGRRPDSVAYGGAEEDVRRRDFTINGLLYDPISGRVIDLVGGLDDIGGRIVRTIGDPRERFGEDHLRLLRAVRLAAQLGFEIESGTWAALVEDAPLVRTVSNERVRDELLKILAPDGAVRGLELLRRSGLLGLVLPAVAALEGGLQPAEYHPEGDVWTHTLGVVENLPPDAGTELALAALLHDVGKPRAARERSGRIGFPGHQEVGARLAEEICRRLVLSGSQTQRVVDLVGNHMRFHEAPRMRLATLKRLLALPGIEEHLALHRADLASGSRPADSWEFCRRRLAELSTEPERLRPPRLVSGRDLLEMGLRPGRDVGRILAELEEAHLDERIATREEALELARRLVEEVLA